MSEENKPVIIRRSEDFVVDSIGKVHRFTALDPALALANNEKEVIYEGFTIIGAPMPDGQMARIPVEFAIDGATSLEEAFSMFKSKAQERFKEMVAEANAQSKAQQNKIVTASQVPPPMRIVE